ncbi:Excinuclease ABC subunit C [Methylophaga frappieri]|uniref:UvrABC system protein C n=1 Tax=Methylophaga frappieri (strain ATCC BAA-2434 / DSM 25690 / JAM7) TaxID=754477 RepID=I1YH48_METFJ|nr:excinuclease ABC subunit UvrC [Methylophaga frappieri]AFJ02241.1 Excinuclease ABC subunit C [Methylophaga frappieri]
MTQTQSKPTFDAERFVKNLTSRPGVYQMVDGAGDVIYVGKAKNLKKRVGSYFRKTGLTAKTRVMVAQIADINTTVTHTENEALILENNLIKALMPRYNVLLRDDKSYPYLLISGDRFPRLSVHRGAKRKAGKYFGPYPSAGAVRESLNLLQKLFPVRQCEDSFYENRSRPCLQYQIKRCTAPCVDLVSEAEYQRDVQHTILFLEGKNQQVMDDLSAQMNTAAEALQFEQAAAIRDKIISLRRVQERQYVSTMQGDFDVLAALIRDGVAVVEVSFIRGGRNLGSKSYFPKGSAEVNESELLSAFIPQYYLGKDVPAEILISEALVDQELLQAVLQSESGHKVSLRQPQRGNATRWLKMTQTNADISLTHRLSSRANLLQRFESLQDALQLDELPKRIECFDISHTRGEKTVASCVVFGLEGAIKADYRKFNIEGITGGDDYAAMNQALNRRFTRLQKGEGKRPDLLLIDGGKGQISEAQNVLAELNLSDLPILGIAKGPERRPGEETLFLVGRAGEVTLPADSSALHLLQQVRDEAHRFAITGHRARRAKARKTSSLEAIPGLGAKRRQKILQQFGGLQEVQRAGVEDLARVEGISQSLAQKIYDTFHPDT